MRDGPIGGRFHAAEVEDRLTEAGRVLLTLPWSGCFPAGFRSLWPDQLGPSSRHRVPTAQEISAMDAAYAWTSFIPDQGERRLVLMRSLVVYDAGCAVPHHVWSWRRIQRMTGLHRDTLRRQWGRGIDRIVCGLNADRPLFGRYDRENWRKTGLCGDLTGQRAIKTPTRDRIVL